MINLSKIKEKNKNDTRKNLFDLLFNITIKMKILTTPQKSRYIQNLKHNNHLCPVCLSPNIEGNNDNIIFNKNERVSQNFICTDCASTWTTSFLVIDVVLMDR